MIVTKTKTKQQKKPNPKQTKKNPGIRKKNTNEMGDKGHKNEIGKIKEGIEKKKNVIGNKKKG